MKRTRPQRGQSWRSHVRSGSNASGFSQLELLVTLVVVSTLALILVPSWLRLMNSQALNHTQDAVYQTMRTAQSQAKKNRMVWQASFRNTPQGIQTAVHPVSALPSQLAWSTLSPDTQIDTVNSTLYHSADVYRIQFGYMGGINGQMGRLTVQKGDRPTKRCVITSGLLGALRKASDQDCNRTP